MFKFGFNQTDEYDDEELGGNELNHSSKNVQTPIKELPCIEFEEIFPKADELMKTTKHGKVIFAGGQEVLILEAHELDNMVVIENKHIEELERESSVGHSDLVPGVYEGGGKIWECTQDLGDFMTKNSSGNDQNSIFSGLSGLYVLDLGCGAGSLGILALQAGANVHFQDYNKEVISRITIENVNLNCIGPSQEMFNRCRFYSGDWMNYLKATLDDIEFDVILTCETIYNPANYSKVLNLLKSKLKKTGVAYLAAKTYYFGVGGGLRDFEKVISDDGVLQTEVMWISTQNVPREILKITHKCKSMDCC